VFGVQSRASRTVACGPFGRLGETGSVDAEGTDDRDALETGSEGLATGRFRSSVEHAPTRVTMRRIGRAFTLTRFC
jgi:hypothetical protein